MKILPTIYCVYRLEPSNFIQITESRQGLKIACIEEIVYDKGYITLNQLKKLAYHYLKTTMEIICPIKLFYFESSIAAYWVSKSHNRLYQVQ